MKLKINAKLTQTLAYNELKPGQIYHAITPWGESMHCVLTTYTDKYGESEYGVFSFEDMYEIFNLKSCMNWEFRPLDDAEITITYRAFDK